MASARMPRPASQHPGALLRRGTGRWRPSRRWSATSSSITPWAATRRIPGSSAGTGAPRTTSRLPRPGRPWSRSGSPGSALPGRRARPGMEAGALQPVPRHARRHGHRAGLRRRTGPARRGDGDRGTRPEPGGPVAQSCRRPPRRARDVPDPRVQPARLAGPDRRGTRVRRPQADRRRGRRDRRAGAIPAHAVVRHGVAPGAAGWRLRSICLRSATVPTASCRTHRAS